jgi:hypothetical protein
MLAKFSLYDIPLYSQIDPRWRNVLLGESRTLTLGTHGCVVCCLSMLLSGVGYNVDPVKVNDDMRKARAFLPGTGRAIWARVANAYPLIKYSYQVFYDKRAADVKFIKELTDSLPVLVELLLNNRDPHWVLAVRGDVNGLLIHDPLLSPANQRRDYLHVIRPNTKIRRIVIYEIVRAE